MTRSNGVAAVRKFQDAPAVRGQTQMLFGLIGPSGSGKTFSGLRMATGFQRVFGGEIFVIDTEKGRAKHYADMFKFRHVPFDAPFSPLDYITAIEYCAEKGASTIIVDSMSHEHSGQGGVLEWHEEEVERIMAAWKVNEDKANIPAWNKPKAARRKLINVITQLNVNVILCFRAKDKIKIGGGKVVQLGWMPDAGEEFVFELTAKALLLPGAGGVPTWRSDQEGEQRMIKLPEQFRGIFSGAAGKPLDEDIGEQLARWAAGPSGTSNAKAVTPTVADYDACADKEMFVALEKRRQDAWKSIDVSTKAQLKTASDTASKRLSQPSTTAAVEKQSTDTAAESTSGAPISKIGYDSMVAMQCLRECKTEEHRIEVWQHIVADYKKEGRSLPIDVEAVNNDVKERIAQEQF